MAATFVVEDGTGLSTANSLASIAEATQYNEDHAASTTWSALSTADQQKHLRLGTQYVSTKYLWKGTRVLSTQALAWPRYDVYVDGFLVDSAIVPADIKAAVVEAAIRSAAGEILLPDLTSEANLTYDRTKIGPLEFETRNSGGASSTTVYSVIRNLVRNYIYDSGTVVRG